MDDTEVTKIAAEVAVAKRESEIVSVFFLSFSVLFSVTMSVQVPFLDTLARM